MIFLTEAPNDADLIPLLGAKAQVIPLSHGDFSWFGVWEDSDPIQVCGDRKKVDDLIKCVNDGRHLSQVERAHAAGYRYQFVIIEGRYRRGKDGLLEVPRAGKWNTHFTNVEYHRVEAYLNQLTWYGHVRVMTSHTPSETADRVVELYSMFQRPPEEHTSLNAIYSEAPPQVRMFGPPSLIKKVAKELPGVGWKRAAAVEAQFPSVLALAQATPEDIEKVEGIGKRIAFRVHNAIREIAR